MAYPSDPAFTLTLGFMSNLHSCETVTILFEATQFVAICYGGPRT